ncbi:hypothetical protein FRC09_010664 [Ceratobasidium sp. 395]|nr:hypothetical protein FRC09_010664 [Ceratobasidium sp. 395]
MAIMSSVVLVVFHLEHLRDAANTLTRQLCAVLGVLEIHIVTEVLLLNGEVDEESVARIDEELLPKAPYHLAVLFFTESDPRGGWWISSAKGTDLGGRCNEDKFISYHTTNLIPLAQDALTARLFPVTCGMNMFNEKTVGRIYEAVNIRPWHSVLFASAPSVSPTRFVDFFPELFVHLFYFGAPFQSSVLRTWAKSYDARQQTGLVIMDRAHWRDGPLGVQKIEHAPYISSPYGHDLPMIPSLCGCWDQAPHHWRLRFSDSDFGEWFGYYVSSCCAVELHVAVYTAHRTVRDIHGTTIVQEVWDSGSARFLFDSKTMICVEISVSGLRAQDVCGRSALMLSLAL